MAKGSGIKTSKGGNSGSDDFFAAYKRPETAAKAPAPSVSEPSEANTLSAIDAAAKASGSEVGRAFIADVRDRMGGTREQQDAHLTRLQKEGKIVMYSNDVPRQVTPREAAGGIQFGDPSIARPRTIVYRVKP